MTLHQWARQWGINPDAVADLERRLGTEPFEASQAAGKPQSESAAQALVQLEASHAGVRLWRNNNGAAYDAAGNLVRYGLANTSKAVNQRIKSSDLVGIRPVVISAPMVGTTIGQFIAREMKRPGWKYTGGSLTGPASQTPAAKRERAQLRWLNVILSMGGDAGFATGPGTI